MSKDSHGFGELRVTWSEKGDGEWVVKGRFMGKAVMHRTGLPEGAMKAAHLVRHKIEVGILKVREEDWRETGEMAKRTLGDAFDEARRFFGKKVNRSNLCVLGALENAMGRTRLLVDVDEVWWRGLFEREIGASDATYVRYTKCLKTVMRLAVEKGMLVQAPVLRVWNADVPRVEFLNMEEIQRVLEWVYRERPWMYVAVMMLVDTGARPIEARAMVWEDVTEDGFLVRKRGPGKTRTRTRTVPFTARTKAFVESVPKDRRVGPIIRFGRDTSYMTEWTVMVGRTLDDACLELGIERKIRTYDLRHTFAYQCGMMGVDLAELSVMMGHATMQQTMVYRPFLKSKAAAVLARVGGATAALAEAA